MWFFFLALAVVFIGAALIVAAVELIIAFVYFVLPVLLILWFLGLLFKELVLDKRKKRASI